MKIMNNLKVFLSIVILVVILPTATSSFDYFKLALQWPPTIKGKLPQPMNFTIHGVWPHNFTSWSSCPLLTNPYVAITDPILLPRLEASWLGSNDLFWEHEREKHGGCSQSSYDQTQYFMLGIQLKDRYNVYELLDSNSFFGRRRKLLSNIDAAIHSGTHKKTEFTCNGSGYLREIQICFDPNLVAIDCPHNSVSNCPPFRVYIAQPPLDSLWADDEAVNCLDAK